VVLTNKKSRTARCVVGMCIVEFGATPFVGHSDGMGNGGYVRLFSHDALGRGELR
jgi:hypothetical protein